MRRGFWHQFGDRSQCLVEEQLADGNGVGVIISPRDLAYEGAVRYTMKYKRAGAQVLIDQQFYEPSFTNPRLGTYPINEFRVSVSHLNRFSNREARVLGNTLEQINRRVGADAVIAPALAYEAGRPEIDHINARLFRVAKSVGDALGVPTYATVVLGQSCTTSQTNTDVALSHATALDADGWYYAYEFAAQRIPSDEVAVLRCCRSGLALACTGMPVLHAYAGPMALLSMGFGATAAAAGHSQNLWRFARERWADSTGQGGGGDAPPRFFSSALWGTIIYPDEIALLPVDLRGEVLTHSTYSEPVRTNLPWRRWDANKHLISVIGRTVAHIATSNDPTRCAEQAIRCLEGARALHGRIAGGGLNLKDGTNEYQTPWFRAMQSLVTDSASDFSYLSLLS